VFSKYPPERGSQPHLLTLLKVSRLTSRDWEGEEDDSTQILGVRKEKHPTYSRKRKRRESGDYQYYQKI